MSPRLWPCIKTDSLRDSLRVQQQCLRMNVRVMHVHAMCLCVRYTLSDAVSIIGGVVQHECHRGTVVQRRKDRPHPDTTHR